MKKMIHAAVLSVSLSLSAIVVAEAPVHGTMEAFVVETNKGKESLKVAEQVEPDQLVEYHLTYVNKSSSGISGLTVVGPVPEGTSYVNATAASEVASTFRVSIDGGVTFEEEPVVREVIKANGEVVEKIVPVDEYTHVQWQADAELKGKGGSQLYRYRVRVK